MSQIKVGVLRGGIGAEYEISLQSGFFVLKHLPEPYQGFDILIAKDGTWHFKGLPIAPWQVARQVDVVFNALHGFFGEDGQVQTLLDGLLIPYTGSGPLASALAMRKSLTKELLRGQDIKVPPGLIWRRQSNAELETQAGTAAELAFRRLAPPWVVKPENRGSSVGVVLAPDLQTLAVAIYNCFSYSDSVLIESYIRGREATCAVIDGLRGTEHYVPPVIEIRRPAGRAIWNYTDKYSGETAEICPGCFTSAEKNALAAAAVKVHRLLGLRDYSRSDFIVSPRGIYLLEVNSLPGLTATSLLPKSLSAVGISAPQFFDHILTRALARK